MLEHAGVEENKIMEENDELTTNPVLFLFTGQGSQYEGMGQGLYENEPAFRDALDRCAAVFDDVTGESLLDVMYPRENEGARETRSGDLPEIEDGGASPDGVASRTSAELDEPQVPKPCLNDTQYTQPAVFALEWSLAELWRSRGVVPSAMVGHSLGEIVAACVAGVMSMETAMELTIQRSGIMQVCS